MPVYVYPSVQYAKTQVWDGSEWVNLLRDSTGRVHTVPPSQAVSITGVSSTGATPSYDTVTGAWLFTWVVIIHGTSSGTHVRFQGSVDNTNWFDLDDYTGTESWMRHVVYKPVRYVRAYVDDLGGADSVDIYFYALR